MKTAEKKVLRSGQHENAQNYDPVENWICNLRLIEKIRAKINRRNDYER